MDEQQIAASLRENIPRPEEPIAPPAPQPAVDEQSSMVSDAVNELALLKLSNELGVVRPDTTANERLKFIHEQLVAVSPDTSYEGILSTLKDYLTRLGLNFHEDRMMRLYLWLKLNQESIAIQREMANVVG